MFEPLVLVPHLVCDPRLFWAQIVRFGQTRAVHLATLTGESVEEMADGVLAGAPGRFALCGLGLGGAVALEMLRRAPDRIARLALISTDPLAEPPAVAAAREGRRVLARADKLDQAIAQEFPPETLAPGPARREVAALLSDMARGFGAEGYLRHSKAWQRRPDHQKTLRRTIQPTLILCGAHDSLVPQRRQEFTAQLMPRAELCVLPHSGHFPTLEDTAGTTRALANWLARPVS